MNDDQPSERAAAGVFVYRQSPTGPLFLLLRNSRRGDWGVPKGHRDDDDVSLEECALRELREETGITDVVLDRTFHDEIRYTARRKPGAPPYTKSVTYFIGRVDSPTVQLSDEHSAADWCDTATTRTRLFHPNLQGVFDRVLLKLGPPK